MKNQNVLKIYALSKWRMMLIGYLASYGRTRVWTLMENLS